MNQKTRQLLEGALSGVIATVAMTGFMALGHKVGTLGEPPPKKLVRRTLRRLGVGAPAPATLGVATALAHLGFGATMGSLYSLLSLASPRRRFEHAQLSGALFGLGVWTASYVGVLPKLGLMTPPKRDRPGRPTTMALAHLVYGDVLGAMFKALRKEVARS